MSIVRVRGGSLAFGHVPLLDQIELNVEAGERVCLIGRNGTGKSTLLNVLAGEQRLDGGELWRRDGLKTAKLAQEVPETEALSLFEVVAAGLGDHKDLLARFHRASHALAEHGNAATPAELDAFGRLQVAVEDAGAWEGSQRIEATLDRLALPGEARMSEVSGGVRRRTMLAQALVSEPDLLLLDEPTNHLDIQAIDALEEALLGYAGTVIYITHDRTLIDNLATRIVELDRGELRSFPGDYGNYLRRKTALLEAQADADRKFDQNLATEEVWIRQGIKARRTRNEGRVRRLESLRRERAARVAGKGDVKMSLRAGERSGKLVLEADGVDFGYRDLNVVRNFSTLVLRGDRIGIIGRNGSGKSTLLKLLLGDLEPTQGSIRRGSKLEVAYFDQERAQLDGESSVRDTLAEGSDHVVIDGTPRHVISYLADFLFPPARARSPVRSLSGGERNRLLLAKLFAKPANLLVLDEPTNDLDVETLELLEDLLSSYDGTLLLVSHDRSFLDRTVTSTLVMAGDGVVEEHVGGYSDWLRHAQSAPPSQREPTPRRDGSSERAADTTVQRREVDGSSRKMGYKERRELDALPARIETIEANQAALQAQIADPEFYKGPQERIASTMKALAEVEAELKAAYDRWEEIEG